MDKKTELLVSLAASTAANCMPCFNYYYQQAEKLGLDLDSADILQAMEIANKIKNGIGMLMRDHVRKTLGLEKQNDWQPCWEKEKP